MNKDFLWGGTSAANQYEGGYDVRKNHEKLFKKLQNICKNKALLLISVVEVKMIF